MVAGRLAITHRKASEPESQQATHSPGTEDPKQAYHPRTKGELNYHLWSLTIRFYVIIIVIQGQQDDVTLPISDTSLDNGTKTSSWLEVATEMINDHLQIFRAIPLVMGVAGTIMVLRHSRMVQGKVCLHSLVTRRLGLRMLM